MDKYVYNYIRILHTDLSLCNYIRIPNPYVTVTYDSLTNKFLSVCNPYVTIFYIQIYDLTYRFVLYVIPDFFCTVIGC